MPFPDPDPDDIIRRDVEREDAAWEKFRDTIVPDWDDPEFEYLHRRRDRIVNYLNTANPFEVIFIGLILGCALGGAYALIVTVMDRV